MINKVKNVSKEPGPLHGSHPIGITHRRIMEEFGTERGNPFAGKTINDIANALSTGEMSVADVPVRVVIRPNGEVLIVDTRSGQALTRADIPRCAWNVIDETSNGELQFEISARLFRNGLSDNGEAAPLSRGMSARLAGNSQAMETGELAVPEGIGGIDTSELSE